METAIQAIYRDLEYARSLIKKPHVVGETPDDSEESWTFVGDESDAEHVGKMTASVGKMTVVEKQVGSMATSMVKLPMVEKMGSAARLKFQV